MPDYMYRTQIISEPEFERYEAFDDNETYVHDGRRYETWYRPVGWVASPDYVDHYKTNKYFEPRVSRWYKSRSSAAERAKLLNDMGYTAIVQRSAPIVWPKDGQKRVEVSEGQKLRSAINTLVAAGLISGADELFRR
ncbi:hypothetical protein OS127_03045 [Corynebacterium sp. P6129]|uniref:hypothetical protein n=1 Tax=Corynebacterium antarcticum TaxID=2800405 RepID=UPI002260BD89|nr:hypothetical protein [Corynebacterium antarcticum]MCX7491505.1 hypothetical protein [Corynebacterium antarcticum]